MLRIQMQELQNKAHQLGLGELKIAGVEPFSAERDILRQRVTDGLLTSASGGNVQERTDPDAALPGAASIVCAAVSTVLPEDAKQDSRLARFARVRDYHMVLGSAMSQLADWIQEQDADAQYRISVDTGPLVERAAACRAGLGFIGKNCSLITPRAGSFVLLGAVLTTVPLAVHPPVQMDCGDCRACLDACPTGALTAPYTLQETACLSYLTQKKGWIPREYRGYMSHTLWGCDVCQDVCPYNRVTESATVTLWDPNKDEIHLPDLPDILAWDTSQYQSNLGESALSWRGRTVLQRNALIMLGNRQDPGDAALAAAHLQDSRSVIRGHAAWALGNIGTAGSRQHLTTAMKYERDAVVQEEIKAALHI